jgi:hypothetical protein
MINGMILRDWFQRPYETWGIDADVDCLVGRPDQLLTWEPGAEGKANPLMLMDDVGNNFKENARSSFPLYERSNPHKATKVCGLPLVPPYPKCDSHPEPNMLHHMSSTRYL